MLKIDIHIKVTIATTNSKCADELSNGVDYSGKIKIFLTWIKRNILYIGRLAIRFITIRTHFPLLHTERILQERCVLQAFDTFKISDRET